MLNVVHAAQNISSRSKEKAHVCTFSWALALSVLPYPDIWISGNSQHFFGILLVNSILHSASWCVVWLGWLVFWGGFFQSTFWLYGNAFYMRTWKKTFDLLGYSIQDLCSFFKTNLKIGLVFDFFFFFLKFTLLNYIWIKAVMFSSVLIPWRAMKKLANFLVSLILCSHSHIKRDFVLLFSSVNFMWIHFIFLL